MLPKNNDHATDGSEGPADWVAIRRLASALADRVEADTGHAMDRAKWALVVRFLEILDSVGDDEHFRDYALGSLLSAVETPALAYVVHTLEEVAAGWKRGAEDTDA